MGPMRSVRPVRVELVGLFPMIFNLCAKCVGLDWVREAGIEYASGQLAEYPREVIERNYRAAEIYQRLAREFGPRIVLETVDTASPRGLWLSLRRGLNNDLHLLINGRVLSGDAEYESIVAAIRQEMGAA